MTWLDYLLHAWVSADFSETKLPPASDIIFFANQYFAKILLYNDIGLSAFCPFDYQEFAMIICKAKIFAFIKGEISSLMTIHSLPGISREIILSFDCIAENQDVLYNDLWYF